MSIVSAVLSWCADHPEACVMAVTVIAGAVMGKPAFDAALASKRAKQIFAAGHIAFHAVEEAHRLAPDNDKLSAADKVALFLDHIDTLLEAQGGDLLDSNERVGAVVLANALHAAQKAGAPLDPPSASPKT